MEDVQSLKSKTVKMVEIYVTLVYFAFYGWKTKTGRMSVSLWCGFEIKTNPWNIHNLRDVIISF